MGNVVCEYCGLEAHTKCPICRNVFPEEIINPFTDCLFTLRQGNQPHGKIDGADEVHFIIERQIPEDEEFTLQKRRRMVERLHYTMNEYPLEKIQQLFCRHHWVWKEGCKSTIGCNH